MFCNFYLEKSHKIGDNPATTDAKEKISTYLESFEFFDVDLTKFETNQILLNKISRYYLPSTKLFTWSHYIISKL